MISSKSFSREWIEFISQKYGYRDKALIEKVIRAFSLLEALVDSGVPLVFKGGSAILLLLKDGLNRLSIDVDVICPPGTDILKYLRNMDKYGFIRVSIVNKERSGKNLPASHSKVYYEVAFKNPNVNDAYIRLDVLYEDNPYTNIVAMPIDLPFLYHDGVALKVNLPTVEEILGDKMTAFGPNSIGIPYYKGTRDCSLDIIKQLFDIGRLFDAVDNFDNTYDSFLRVSEMELGYRNLIGKINCYYDDVRRTSMSISSRGSVSSGAFVSLQNGIRRIESYMYQKPYYIENAICDSAKVAYLATCFEYGIKNVEKYSPEMDLTSFSMKGLPCKIQRLRKVFPEAYYYWAKVSDIVDLNSIIESEKD